MEGAVSDNHTLDTRRWAMEEDNVSYSWLFDIIHDHTEDIFRHGWVSGPDKVSAPNYEESHS